jgi:hypothetical protein
MISDLILPYHNHANVSFHPIIYLPKSFTPSALRAVVSFAYTGKLGLSPQSGDISRPSLFELAEILALSDYLIIPNLNKKLTNILATSIPIRGINEPSALIRLIILVMRNGSGPGVRHMQHWGVVLMGMLYRYCHHSHHHLLPYNLSIDQIISAGEFDRMWKLAVEYIPDLAETAELWAITDDDRAVVERCSSGKHLPMYCSKIEPSVNICTLQRDLSLLLLPLLRK